jgi:hypothetical protein
MLSTMTERAIAALARQVASYDPAEWLRDLRRSQGPQVTPEQAEADRAGYLRALNDLAGN